MKDAAKAAIPKVKSAAVRLTTNPNRAHTIVNFHSNKNTKECDITNLDIFIQKA